MSPVTCGWFPTSCCDFASLEEMPPQVPTSSRWTDDYTLMSKDMEAKLQKKVLFTTIRDNACRYSTKTSSGGKRCFAVELQERAVRFTFIPPNAAVLLAKTASPLNKALLSSYAKTAPVMQEAHVAIKLLEWNPMRF